MRTRGNRFPWPLPVALCARAWRTSPQTSVANISHYDRLRQPHGGTSCALPRGMKLTQPILKTISRQLCHGNPWWGLVVLNEYLAPTSPLHAALVTRFRRRVPTDSELARQLCSGARWQDLGLEERSQIGSRVATDSRRLSPSPRDRKETLGSSARRHPVRRVVRPITAVANGQHDRRARAVTLTTSTAVPALRAVPGAARKLS